MCGGEGGEQVKKGKKEGGREKTWRKAEMVDRDGELGAMGRKER